MRVRMCLAWAVGCAIATLLVTSPARADEARLVILPETFQLAGPRAEQTLLVEQWRDGLYRGQAAGAIRWTSSDPAVVIVHDGIARPVGNGQATLSATVDQRTAQCQVSVVGMDEPFVWNFRNHVQSVLAKTNCSSGPCHGAQAGKNGFRLSLRGYDAAGDWQAITRHASGRRIVPADPGRSLLLTKPTGAVAHKGGLRFRVDSREYQVIAEWIAAGAPPPHDADPRLERLEILPPGAVLGPGARQQLIVLAHFSDGHMEDVTRWAKFTSANESVAQVDDAGQVTIMGHGEGAITAWYLSQIVVGTVTSPFENDLPADTFAQAPSRNFIDELVLAKLQSLNVPPSPRASDGEFVRRVYLDTLGKLPTLDETRKFLADQRADRRDRLIDELLARPEFVDYWSYKWSDLLLVNTSKLAFGNRDNTDARPLWAYYSWIRNHVEANTPWDQVVRQLLTATGSTLENGATNFYVLHQDPLDLAETTTVAFLGTNINCARCHNHPLEKWTNNQYYALANLFARVRVKTPAAGGQFVVFSGAEGDLIQPLTGKPQPPTPLDGEPLPLEATVDRRIHLAEWLVSPENPLFARAITNRIWANYLGVGLVEMVDDLRQSNPASNPQLLDVAAQYLIDADFDLKALMRTILQSETYQRSSRAIAGNEGDDRFYSRYYPRRLMAEVMLDAMSEVTGAPTEFQGFPVGWRAMQLPSTTVASYFLQTFGRPERVVTCECERTDEPSMVQVLHISNGETLNGKLRAAGNRIEQWLASGIADDQLIDEVYLSALSRLPTREEKSRIQQLFAAEADQSDRRQLIEDLCWSVLSSKEFLFNH